MIYACPSCTKKFQSEADGVVECPSCGQKLKLERSVAKGSPWDRGAKGGWVSAFFDTVKSSIVDPIHFFEEVKEGEGSMRPWLYAVITLFFAFLVGAAYQAGFQALSVSVDIAAELKKAVLPVAALSFPIIIIGVILMAVIVIPIIATLKLFMQAGLNHLCLMILGAAKRDFWSTFRTVGYAHGPQLFQVVPIIGGFVGPLWELALVIIGLKVSHETSYGKSALAVFLPTIACCSLLIFGVAAIGGGIVASLLTHVPH